MKLLKSQETKGTQSQSQQGGDNNTEKPGKTAQVHTGGKLREEIVAYLIFGALTTVISIASYYACNTWLGIHYLISNIISWILAVAFAYVTNKWFVFRSRASSFQELRREIWMFFAARLASLGIEELGLLILVSGLTWGENISKLLMQVIVMIMNYVFSKWFIFKKKPRD